MLIGHLSSTTTAKCIKCGKPTGTYKTYDQSGIEIRIPLCDRDERHCYREVDIKFIADTAIKLIKREGNHE